MEATERLLEEISLMSDAELRKYLVEEVEGKKVHLGSDEFATMNRQEMLDFLCDYLHPDLQEYLHSEFIGDKDYSSMHPNETLEEFLEHEDH